MNRDRLRALRGAVARGDGPGVVEAIGEAVPPEVLQLAGDGLVLASTGGVTGAAGPADECSVALRARGWAGDDGLAADLDAAIGRRASGLRLLAGDLEELSEVLESGAGVGGGLIDLDSGQVGRCPRSSTHRRPRRRRPISTRPIDGWTYLARVRPMATATWRFIDAVTDPDRADRLRIAIDGRGTFRRFKDVLARWPDEEERWYRFSDERRCGRARQWLADAGYRPARRRQGTTC